MRFTKEQMEILSTWEKHFETAVKADWARNPGQTALETMHNILDTAMNKQTRLNVGCGNCVLRLLKDVGRQYLAQKEEVKVEVKEVEVEAKRVEVKTRPLRKRTKKEQA